MAALYPPSPRHVPEDLTSASSEYRTQGTLVLLALIFFAGCYTLAILACLVLPVLAFLYGNVVLGIPMAIFCGGTFFFLIKGFFKKQYKPRTFNIEIQLHEHPKLEQFVEELCEETGAPLPHRVFLSPEVNAAVFYDGDSLLDLFIPPPKNLLIGMGLVNVLTLSEFKAVLAHEFGHFSQKGMLLHRYIYSANQIMIDLVYGRDWFDDIVLHMRDHPENGLFNAIGWTIFGPLWVFRKGLEAYLYMLNLLGAGLSRQMEFNADLVAVSVAGSDAIVMALSRLDFAGESLGQALDELKAASDHELFTADLFHHMNHASAYLRKTRKKPTLGEPPPLPPEEDLSPEVFDEEDDAAPEMWSTHPSNYDREQNAKRVYLRVPLDPRSPWLLFENVDELRERVTWRFYRVVWGIDRDVALSDPDEVQQFIDEEHAETTYHPRYHGVYDNRPLQLPDLEDLAGKVRREPWKADVLANLGRRLYLKELEDRMTEIKALREERDKLEELNEKAAEENVDFKFRGKRYDDRDLGRLMKKVMKELDEQYDWLGEFDQRVFRVHYQMARELDKKRADELLARYEFHAAAQTILIDLAMHRPKLQAALNALGDGGKLDYDTFHAIRSILIEAHDAMTRGISKADKLRLPALKNMKEGAKLGTFLVPGSVVKGLRPGAQRFTSKWLNKFLNQLGAMEDRIRRIHFKSLGGILALQEETIRTWLRDGPKMDRLEEDEEPVEAEAEAEEDEGGTYRLKD
jgi:Zn-dependent protease with chaperone function